MHRRHGTSRFDVPRIVVGGEDTLEELHEALFNVLAGIAGLHLLGALKHWLARRRHGDAVAP